MGLIYSRRSATSEALVKPSSQALECGICGDEVRLESKHFILSIFALPKAFKVPACNHLFCRTCLQTYTRVKVGERCFPIPCPGCLADPQSGSSNLELDIIDQLKLSSEDSRKLLQLQIEIHAVILTCPSCKKSMYFDRKDYVENKTLICPLPGCCHTFCRDCDEPIGWSFWMIWSLFRSCFTTFHICPESALLDRVMVQNGWKYCPGCRTPIEKRSGCNYMNCQGCNATFCYGCGKRTTIHGCCK